MDQKYDKYGCKVGAEDRLACQLDVKTEKCKRLIIFLKKKAQNT